MTGPAGSDAADAAVNAYYETRARVTEYIPGAYAREGAARTWLMVTTTPRPRTQRRVRRSQAGPARGGSPRPGDSDDGRALELPGPRRRRPGIEEAGHRVRQDGHQHAAAAAVGRRVSARSARCPRHNRIPARPARRGRRDLLVRSRQPSCRPRHGPPWPATVPHSSPAAPAESRHVAITPTGRRPLTPPSARLDGPQSPPAVREEIMSTVLEAAVAAEFTHTAANPPYLFDLGPIANPDLRGLVTRGRGCRPRRRSLRSGRRRAAGRDGRRPPRPRPGRRPGARCGAGPFRSVRRAPGASAFTLKPSSARALAYSTVSSFSAVLEDRYAPKAPVGLSREGDDALGLAGGGRERGGTAGDVHDPGMRGAPQRGQERVGDGDHAEHVGLVNAAERVRVLLGHGLRLAGGDSGVVDQDVQGGHLPRRRRDAIGIGDVENERPCVAADVREGVLAPASVPGAGVDGMPRRGE